MPATPGGVTIRKSGFILGLFLHSPATRPGGDEGPHLVRRPRREPVPRRAPHRSGPPGACAESGEEAPRRRREHKAF
jgi:hypothetical protein